MEHIFTQIYLEVTYAFHIHPIHVRFIPQPLHVKIKQAPPKLQQKQNLQKMNISTVKLLKVPVMTLENKKLLFLCLSAALGVQQII